MDDAHKTSAHTTFWLYYETECAEEGACFPFHDRAEAERHAAGSGGPVTDFVFEQRDASDDERVLIKHGIEVAARIVCIACRKGEERRSGWHPYMSPPGKCIAARVWRTLEREVPKT